MATGTAKWFNAGMGFGVIAPDNGNADLYAHFYTVNLNGFKFIKEGQKVSYEVVQSANRLLKFAKIHMPNTFLRSN